jgi:hypothetical protein
MTVRELIEKLSVLPQDLEVVAPGYEGGYHTIKHDPSHKTMLKNVNTEWYYGEHEESSEYEDTRFPNAEKFEAICI